MTHWRGLRCGCSVGRAALAAIALLTSACTTFAPTVAERQYAGRFGLTAERVMPDGTPRRESLSGRFVLAAAAGGATLDLATPLGVTLARLETTAMGARLLLPEDGGLREVRDRDAEALAERVLGFPLPLTGLPWWIRGEPVPARTMRMEGDAGFQQDGWRVAVDERFSGGAPRRMTLTRAALASAPAITLRVALDNAAP